MVGSSKYKISQQINVPSPYLKFKNLRNVAQFLFTPHQYLSVLEQQNSLTAPNQKQILSSFRSLNDLSGKYSPYPTPIVYKYSNMNLFII